MEQEQPISSCSGKCRHDRIRWVQKYCDVELIAVGVPDSHDLEAARTAAKLIGMKVRTIEVDEKEMVSEGIEMQKQIALSGIEVEFNGI